MSDIIRNVIILKADDYLQRGWCVYEYIVSSLNHSIACDEINHDNFRNLRNWTYTPAIDGYLDHLAVHGIKIAESDHALRTNFKNEQIIEAVNQVVPYFQGTRFTIPEDLPIVKQMLIEELKNKLPLKKDKTPYGAPSKLDVSCEVQVLTG